MNNHLDPEPEDGFRVGQRVYSMIERRDGIIVSRPEKLSGAWSQKVRFPDGSISLLPVRQVLARLGDWFL